VRDQLARAGGGGGGDDTYGRGDVAENEADRDDEWDLARAPSGDPGRRLPRPGEAGADGNAAADGADARAAQQHPESSASEHDGTEGGGGPGNGTAPGRF